MKKQTSSSYTQWKLSELEKKNEELQVQLDEANQSLQSFQSFQSLQSLQTSMLTESSMLSMESELVISLLLIDE